MTISKKKLIIIHTCVVIVQLLCLVIAFKERQHLKDIYHALRDRNKEAVTTEWQYVEGVRDGLIAPEVQVQDAPKVDNTLMYMAADGEGNFYREAEKILVQNTDKMKIGEYYQLPELIRMDSEDAKAKMANLQALKRIEVMGYTEEDFDMPKYQWKSLYGDSIQTVKKACDFKTEVIFEGQKISELNAFLTEQKNVVVSVVAEFLELDETLKVPSNVTLKGNGTIVSGTNKLTYGFLLEGVENVTITGFVLDGGCEEGIYVLDSSKVLLISNELKNMDYKAICIMATNSYVNVCYNDIHDNGNGAFFVNGDVSHSIFQGNEVWQNRGTRNLTAGMCLSSMPVEDKYTPYNQFQDEHLYDQLAAPHHNILLDNTVQGNYSSGMYSDGGYLNYFIDNLIEDNEKEGMCLDYGTFGTYIAGNTIRRNGERNRQTDEDLEADFILWAGRCEDGSSKAKLPGISIDNAAYNIVDKNIIEENSGSGVKMVRSGYRNIVVSNILRDNNAGRNDWFHGFGMEVGYAKEPDEPVIGLDFTPCYENIIARNTISGRHYSGIFLAEESYCNDMIGNVIYDCQEFAVENFSGYYNDSRGNTTNLRCLNYDLH